MNRTKMYFGIILATTIVCFITLPVLTTAADVESDGMLPTATDDQLGTGKWSAGPMGLAVYLSDKWIIGGVAQHWWSFAGDDNIKVNTTLGNATIDRPDVNLTDFQYILRYRLTPVTNIGCAPNIQYNWETDQLSLPVGLGMNALAVCGLSAAPAPIQMNLLRCSKALSKIRPSYPASSIPSAVCAASFSV